VKWLIGGRELLAMDNWGGITRWDAATGLRLEEVVKYAGSYRAMVLSRDERLLVAWEKPGIVVVVDCLTKQQTHRLGAESAPFETHWIAVSPDNRFAVRAGLGQLNGLGSIHRHARTPSELDLTDQNESR
jgi:hypothetical protein